MIVEVDLMISDIMMPLIDGFELIESLRDANYNLPILVVTAKEGFEAKEFQLLFKLLNYPKRIFTRQQLMSEIWGLDTEIDERTVDSHIKKLRKKFEDRSEFKIITIRGLGYKAEKIYD